MEIMIAWLTTMFSLRKITGYLFEIASCLVDIHSFGTSIRENHGDFGFIGGKRGIYAQNCRLLWKKEYE